jgi:diguanylate cyclase (GGDEF)-like protein
VRRTDLVCRYGGHEFVVLLADLARPSTRSAADVTAAQIRDQLSEPFVLPHGPARVQVSIGAALYPEDTTDPQHLIHLADQGMYRAKSRPRDGDGRRDDLAR